MKSKWIKVYVSVIAMLVIVYTYYQLNKPENLLIDLQWHSGSFIESEEEMKTGLIWALSSLGAELPEGSLDSAISGTSSGVFTLDLSKVGFSESAELALQKIVTEIKASSAYKAHGYTEIGRLIMLTLNNSFHYYEITAVPKTLDRFKALYRFEGKICRVINSSVSKVQRRIEIADADAFKEIAYIATEGSGAFQDLSFSPLEFEAMDFMPNGQLRFALYDKKGNLKQSADSAITHAGKPSKCLWCHETTIQPFFIHNPVLEGSNFVSIQEFTDIRNNYLMLAQAHREALSSDIDFNQKQAHSWMERIYLGFMEPSLEQVAAEWNMTENEVQNILNGLPTHTQEEFKFENLYDRWDVDRLAPDRPVAVSQSPREFSTNELNFFSARK